MMNIRKHFANSKKRNLRDNFKDATYSKIPPREAWSCSNYNDPDFFEECLDSSTFRTIMLNYLKNLECKMNEIYANTNTLKENKIKGKN